MNALEKLFIRIVQRININLREMEFDAKPYVWDLIPKSQMTKFYAFYGISPDHPLNLRFRNSGLAGSYFLGKIQATNSLLYKTDVRGDELKKKGGPLPVREIQHSGFQGRGNRDRRQCICQNTHP